MAEAEQEQEQEYWLTEHIGKDLGDSNNTSAKKILEKMEQLLREDYEASERKYRNLPIFFAVEAKDRKNPKFPLLGFGNSLEELKAYRDPKKVVVAWLIVRCNDNDGTMRAKFVKVSMKGQKMSVMERQMFAKADQYVNETEIKASVDEELFITSEEEEYSGRSCEQLAGQIVKNAGAHSAKVFYFGSEEKVTIE